MNMNYDYPTTIFRSICAQIYEFPVENAYLKCLLVNFQGQNEKLSIIPEGKVTFLCSFQLFKMSDYKVVSIIIIL